MERRGGDAGSVASHFNPSRGLAESGIVSGWRRASHFERDADATAWRIADAHCAGRADKKKGSSRCPFLESRQQNRLTSSTRTLRTSC